MTDYDRFMEFLKQAKITEFSAREGSGFQGNEYGATVVIDVCNKYGDNHRDVQFYFDHKGKFLVLR